MYGIHRLIFFGLTCITFMLYPCMFFCVNVVVHCARMFRFLSRAFIFRAAALPVGAHEPAWFMKEQHCSPEEAVTIHQDLGAKRSFAVHWVSYCSCLSNRRGFMLSLTCIDHTVGVRIAGRIFWLGKLSHIEQIMIYLYIYLSAGRSSRS